MITKDPTTGTETVTYLHTDYDDTPRMATNQSGTILWRWEGVFGGTLPSPNGVDVTLRYPGQTYDSETGLFYNWARYYDPTIGRFVSSDPIGLGGGLNSYLYGRANPLRYIDPEGLDSSTNPPICNGPDCLSPPYDPTPKGPKPAPQPKLPKKPRRDGPDCTKLPTFHACMSCCATVQGQRGTTGTIGSMCAEKCYRKAGITMINPNQCMMSGS